MDWNALKIFLSVADSGSLNAAADRLETSYVTVFRRIKSLEDELEVRLFDRQRGHYTLTEMGARLHAKARAMASLAEEAELQIVGADTAPRGEVTVTAPTSLAYGFLPDYLKSLKTSHPAISVNLLVSNRSLNMSAREADVALRVAADPPEMLVGRKVLNIGWSVYASDSYVARHGRPNDPGDLAQHLFIGASGSLRQRTAFDWLNNTVAPQIGTMTDDLTAMAALAAAGHGLALLPNDLARDGLTRCFTLPDIDPNLLWVLIHPDLRRVQRVQIVSRYLTDRLKGDPRLNLS